MTTLAKKAKRHDIRWPLNPRVLEDINANFDDLYRGAQASVEQTNLTSGTVASITGLPAGTTTGQVVRYNATSGAWETTSEPLVFAGLVLTPALASALDIEGAIYYQSTTKHVLVCTDI
jgi:hypothetical protein